MYERFTDRARKVMQLANQEAQRFNHEYVGSQHILLGLMKEGSGTAANVLSDLGIDLRRIREEVERIVPRSPDLLTLGRLPQTPRVKHVIEHAIHAADEFEALDQVRSPRSRRGCSQFKQRLVGTEHLMLGLLGDEDSMATRILRNLGVSLECAVELLMNAVRREGTVKPAPHRDALRTAKTSPKRERIEELDIPEKTRERIEELAALIDRSRTQKELAIAEEDFERAARLREQENACERKRILATVEWRNEYTIDAAWLTWSAGTVVRLARAIAEERRWQDLPILADALEDAGCVTEDILHHCRQAGEHGDRCWVIDLLLGSADRVRQVTAGSLITGL